MEALRYHSKSKKLELTRIPIPKIERPNDVLVRVKSSGVCGTDLHIVEGKFGAADMAEVTTLGHEFAGVVAAVGGDEGTAVSAGGPLAVGDRVGVDPNSYCHTCEWCAKGQVNYCPRGGLRTTIGIGRNGGFAEYCLVPAEQCFKLPEDVDFDMGALCEPLACIYHGWSRLMRFGPPQPDSRIFILGAGIIGNLWSCMFHHHGHRDVTITEPLLERRNIASKLNEKTGYKVMSPSEAEAILPKTSKEAELTGVDLVVDCTGDAQAFETAVKWMRRGGVICVFGCTPPGERAKLCPEEIFSKELLIFGTQIDPFTYSRSVHLAAGMGTRYLTCEKLGVEVFSLREYEDALHKLEKGTISKAMFRF